MWAVTNPVASEKIGSRFQSLLFSCLQRISAELLTTHPVPLCPFYPHDSAVLAGGEYPASAAYSEFLLVAEL